MASFEAAERYFQEKSYAHAAEQYTALLAAGGLSAHQTAAARLRLSECQARRGQWDTALRLALEFAREYRGTPSEPVGLHWLGRLYAGLPWSAQREVLTGPDGHRTAGPLCWVDVPAPAENAELVTVYCSQQHTANSLAALEAAVLLGQAAQTPSPDPLTEIRCCFDLAQALQPQLSQWIRDDEWQIGAEPESEIDAAARYSADRCPPRQVLYLYARIRLLAAALPNGAEAAALSWFFEGVWLRQYHAALHNFVVREETTEDGGERYTQVPYLYRERTPEAAFRRGRDEFPEHPIRDLAWLELGHCLAMEGRFEEATAELQALALAARTEQLRLHALQIMEYLARGELNLEGGGTCLPGHPVRLTLRCRNLSRTRVELFEFDLPAAFAASRPSTSYEPRLAGIDLPLEQLRTFCGEPLLEQELNLPEGHPYCFRSEPLPLPTLELGAYLVKVTGTGRGGAAIEAFHLLLVTDLAVVQLADPQVVAAYVADALDGHPIAGARVLSRQNVARKLQVLEGQTEPDGLCLLQRAHPGNGSCNLDLLAVHGRRLAILTAHDYWWHRSTHGETDKVRIYCVTDRPVYRPGQPLHFRCLVMIQEEQRWVPLRGVAVAVEITDSRDQSLARFKGTTGEFGTYAGEVELSAEVPLGLGSVSASIEAGRRAAAWRSERIVESCQFRVEEYRKPELLLEVLPAGEAVLGHTASARIRASYYFGAPTAGTKLSYTVRRRVRHDFGLFPHSVQEPAALPLWQGEDDEEDDFSGEYVDEGEGRTDENGELIIVFPATLPERELGKAEPDEVWFTVEVEGTDSSRRTVTGSGRIRVGRSDLRVAVHSSRDYFRSGEPVEVSVATRDSADRPVAAAGQLRVYRPSPDGKSETLHAEWPFETDTAGRGEVRWAPTEAGPFRLAFETHDPGGRPAAGRVAVWVAEPVASAWSAAQGVRLRLSEPAFPEGGTARVLLTGPAEDCSVLLLREVDGVVRSREVLRLPTGVRELELPLSREEVPNFHLTAIAVRGGEVYESQVEVRVAPTEQLARVDVEPERPHYLPGETARLRVRAADWEGRPLQAELSVAVTDAALAYIQKDLVADIRRHYTPPLRQRVVRSTYSTHYETHAVILDHQKDSKRLDRNLQIPGGGGLLREWPLPEDRYWGPQGAYCFEVPGSLAWERERWGPRDSGIRYKKNALPGEEKLYGAAIAVGAAPPSEVSFARACPEAPEEGAAEVRSRFADTALWLPAVVTGPDGEAAVEVTWPDNLTEWRALAIGVSEEGRVGQGEARVHTRKELLLRLQAPRFQVEGDEVTLAANVHSYLPEDVSARVRLELEHPDVELLGQRWGEPGEREVAVFLPAGGEARAEWRIQARCPGMLKVRATAVAGGASDGMELTLPVLTHGVERSTVTAGELRGEAEAWVTIELPQQRRPGRSEVAVRITPSLAATVLDALPYLIEYPYGCVEQTASRFVPAVVTMRLLRELDLKLPDLGKRAELLAEREQEALPNLARVEFSPYTPPDDRTGLLTLAGRRDGVLEERVLKHVIRRSLALLRDAQLADGGWAWWPRGSFSPEITAYVLEGLRNARLAGYTLPGTMLESGREALVRSTQKAAKADGDPGYRELAVVAALAQTGSLKGAAQSVVERALKARERLSTRGLALLARLLHGRGERESAQLVLRNLESTVRTDPHAGTAWWPAPEWGYWWWEFNAVETAATALESYLIVAPESPLVPMLVRWLVANRRGAAWSSTRESALAVQALVRYARATGELAPDYTVTVGLDGRAPAELRITPETALTADSLIVIPDTQLETGAQTLTLRREGAGVAYYTVVAHYFSQEDPIPAASAGISVDRRFYRVRFVSPPQPTADGDETARRGPNPFLTGDFHLLEPPLEDVDHSAGEPERVRVPLLPGDPVESGELLEVELLVRADNEYGYVLLEDIKPAGCEAVEQRSGYRWDQAGAYVELRDQKVAFFLEQVRQGLTQLRYQVRAETPGKFRVLPVQAFAMYAPEVRGLSDERRLTVRD